MRLVAVDPGKNGAAIAGNTDTKKAKIHRLKYDKNNDLNVRSFVNFICEARPELILLETPVISAKDALWSKSGIYAFGDLVGQIKVAIKMADRPTRYIKPTQWQKTMFEGIKTKLPPKEKALIAYSQFYPSSPLPMTKRQKSPHDGEVDALLILTDGVLKYGGGKLIQWEFEL